MNLLLDTCVFLWASGENARLSVGARDALLAAENTLLLSTVSVWEISIKFARGTLLLPQPPSILIPLAREQFAVGSLQLDEPSAILASTLPHLHRDPFDRMLVCQALHHGLAILTPDRLIQQYGVRCIW